MAACRRILWSRLLQVVCVLSAASAQGSDWPQWGGAPARNMASGETGLPDSFRPGRIDAETGVMDPASGENLRWVVKLGTETHGSPVIADGRVYVGSNSSGSARIPAAGGPRIAGGRLVCLDEQTGRHEWELLTPHLPESRAPHSDTGYGVCSSPVVDGDRVYVVTNDAEVLCLDVAGLANGNGGPFQDEGRYLAGAFNQPNSAPTAVQLLPTDADILWRYDMLAEHGVHPHDASSCSVLVDGDVLYVCTGNGINREENKVLNPLAPSLIVLDKVTGRLLAADEEKIGSRVLKGQWSSPSLWESGGRRLIVFGAGDGCCYAFEPLSAPVPARPVSLKKVWAVDCNPAACRFRVATQEYLYAVSRRTGGAAPHGIAAAATTAAAHSAPAPTANPLHSTPMLSDDWPQWRGARRDGHVPQLPKTMPALKVRWQNPVAGACDAGIAVAGDRLVMADHDKRYDYYGCWRADDGKELWKRGFPNGREMDYGAGPRSTPLLYGHKVVVQSAFGEVYCLDLATGDTIWRKDSAKDFGVKNPPTWGYCSSPLLAQGKLIVNPGGKTALVALDPDTGAVVWQGDGGRANYSSFIVGVCRIPGPPAPLRQDPHASHGGQGPPVRPRHRISLLLPGARTGRLTQRAGGSYKKTPLPSSALAFGRGGRYNRQ